MSGHAIFVDGLVKRGRLLPSRAPVLVEWMNNPGRIPKIDGPWRPEWADLGVNAAAAPSRVWRRGAAIFFRFSIRLFGIEISFQICRPRP